MYKNYIKRLIDFVCAIVILTVISPIFIIIAIMIKVDSKGPVFFLQERLGKDGKIFKIFKFRTMITGAEKVGTGVRTSETDPRITKVGAFLRKTSIDELPQLINIINGTMSFVGPRPPVTYHPYNGIDGYPEWMKPRFFVRPGITGLAQQRIRNTAPWDERIKYDVEYIKDITFLNDMKIVFGTFVDIVSRKTVYADTTAQEEKEKANV